MMSRIRLLKQVRQWHRYLGLIVGIQFLFWTLGGFYFSWTNIRQIRSDDIRNELPVLQMPDSIVPLSEVQLRFAKAYPDATISGIQVIQPVTKPACYQIRYQAQHQEHFARFLLTNGRALPLLTPQEAEQEALASIHSGFRITHTERIDSVNGHHEYREKPLPAYAVHVSGPNEYVVYVGAETAQVHAIRNTSWRIFDFLWMLHVMDYKNRDEINNWVLRIFSLLGLVTLASGYGLFILTRRRKRSRSVSLHQE